MSGILTAAAPDAAGPPAPEPARAWFLAVRFGRGRGGGVVSGVRAGVVPGGIGLSVPEPARMRSLAVRFGREAEDAASVPVGTPLPPVHPGRGPGGRRLHAGLLRPEERWPYDPPPYDPIAGDGIPPRDGETKEWAV